MKWLATSLTAAALFMSTGCAEIKEALDEYKTEQVQQEATQQRVRTINVDQPIAKLSVEEISEEFEANSVMAENKYMNQPVELHGQIGMIDDSPFNDQNIIITVNAGEYSLASVSCTKPRTSAAVAQLRKGMSVAVRGVVTSEQMGIGLSRCKFWSHPQKRWIGAASSPPQQSINRETRQSPTTEDASNSSNKTDWSRLDQTNRRDQQTTAKIATNSARFFSSTTGKTKDIGVTITTRKNVNGHTIYDAQWADGFKSSYVFWKSGVVEIISKDGDGKTDNTPGTWRTSDGNIIITARSGSITTFPSMNPIAN